MIKQPIVLTRINIPCGIRIDDRKMNEAVLELEKFHSASVDQQDLTDALSNLCMNYVKFIDVFVMSDGTIMVAQDQTESDCVWSPF